MRHQLWDRPLTRSAVGVHLLLLSLCSLPRPTAAFAGGADVLMGAQYFTPNETELGAQYFTTNEDEIDSGELVPTFADDDGYYQWERNWGSHSISFHVKTEGNCDHEIDSENDCKKLAKAFAELELPTNKALQNVVGFTSATTPRVPSKCYIVGYKDRATEKPRKNVFWSSEFSPPNPGSSNEHKCQPATALRSTSDRHRSCICLDPGYLKCKACDATYFACFDGWNEACGEKWGRCFAAKESCLDDAGCFKRVGWEGTKGNKGECGCGRRCGG
mmetsp:Transcript_14124/g.23489  ORF Transcript_14124/g.23489 Transcript_14124/m.23489 type:complete len:274 (+) Transcript_14124:99-920(+)